MKLHYKIYAVISLLLSIIAIIELDLTMNGANVILSDGTPIQTGSSIFPYLFGSILIASGLVGSVLVIIGKEFGKYFLVTFYLLQTFVIYAENFRFILDTKFSFDLTNQITDSDWGLKLIGIDLFAAIFLYS